MYIQKYVLFGNDFIFQEAKGSDTYQSIKKVPANFKRGSTDLKLALKIIYFGHFLAHCDLLFFAKLKIFAH